MVFDYRIVGFQSSIVLHEVRLERRWEVVARLTGRRIGSGSSRVSKTSGAVSCEC